MNRDGVPSHTFQIFLIHRHYFGVKIIVNPVCGLVMVPLVELMLIVVDALLLKTP